MIAIPELVRVLQTHRLPLTDEKRTQAQLAEVFNAAKIPFEREVHLAEGDIVDFMVGDIALEIKIKGQRRAIFRQLERYASHPRVGVILLATAVAMHLPAEIKGKPALVASLSQGWL